jgi:ribosomal protein S10
MAVGVIALWLAGLGVLTRRELFRPHLERLAEAALRVNQATTYFAVTRDSELVGYSSSIIDTTTTSITITDYLVTEISGPRPRSTSRAKITLTRTLRVREFESSIQTTSVDIRATGRVLGDTAMAFTLTSGGKPSVTQTIPLDGMVLLPQLVPLAIALTEPPRVGRSYTFPVFDPARQAVVQVRSVIRAESVFVLSDSAALDSTTHMWQSAHRDTVRAWRVESSLGGFNGWLDEAGHVVKTETLGSNVDRSTPEEAFDNWVLITTERRMLSLPPSQRPPGWKPVLPPTTRGVSPRKR